MADILYKGSKKKYLVEMEGLSYLHLSDSDVDFFVEFYCNGKYAQGVCKVMKSDCTFVYDEGSTESDSFHAVCDTASLPTGSLVGLITITYPDIDTGLNLKEVIRLDSDQITLTNQ